LSLAEDEQRMLAIAIIGITLGSWLLISALANWDWYKGMVDFAAAETLFGEATTRWLCGLLGLVIIGVGIVGLVRSF
jgi:hypothetical protein